MKRGSHETEYRLWRLWRQAVAPLCAWSAEALEAGALAVCRAAAEALDAGASRGRGLPCVDEQLYVCYERLMNAYAGVLRASVEVDGAGAFIWDGVCAVLLSRVKLYEESNVAAGGNPVADEKKHIVDGAVKALSDGCEALARRFRAESQSDCERAAIQAAVSGGKPSEAVAALIRDGFARQVGGLYRPALQFAVAQLNDLSRRRVACYYDELLTEEREILSSLVRVQIKALEADMTGDDARSLLDDLRVAYQTLCAEHDGLKAGAQGKAEDGADFAQAAAAPTEAPSDAAACEAFANAYRQFTDALAAARGRALDAGLKRQAYEWTKQVYEHDALARELAAAFSGVAAGFEAGEVAPQSERQIVDGILETIAIKLESVREEQARMNADARRELAALRAEAPAKPPAQMNEAELTEALIQAGRDEKAAAAAIKAMVGAQPPARKHEADRIAKRLNAFLREGLLVEISTFEEIMRYSAPLLRTSEDEAAAAFARRLDMAMGEITRVLARYGIEMIRPAPRSAFNGREHEVITAEPAEGYAKGEIIKVLNSGYRRDGVVLIRANVVAAR